MVSWLRRLVLTLSVSALTSLFAVSAFGTDIIDLELDRSPKKLGKIDSENWEISLYGGMMTIEDFDSGDLGGFRLGYHLNEHLFV